MFNIATLPAALRERGREFQIMGPVTVKYKSSFNDRRIKYWYKKSLPDKSKHYTPFTYHRSLSRPLQNP